MAKVLMLLSNPFKPDPRVHKEAKSLIKAGHSVRILCWDRGENMPENEVIDGIDIQRFRIPSRYGVPLSFARGVLRFHKAIKKEAKSLDFDVVHAHDFDTLRAGYKIAKRNNSKLIYDSHESYMHMMADFAPASVVRIFAKMESKLVAKTDGLICVTDKIEKKFKSDGAKRTAVVTNCADLTGVPTEEERQNIRQKWGAGDRTVAMYVGVFEKMRGLERIIDDFPKFAGDEYLLVIGGFGILEPSIKEKCARSDKVLYLGSVEPKNVLPYSGAADILFVTSDPANKNTHFSLHNKIFEGMAVGRPCIVSKGTANEDVIKETNSGFAVEYGNTDELFGKFRELRSNPELYKQLSQSGLKFSKEKYNWSSMEERLIGLYEEVLSS